MFVLNLCLFFILTLLVFLWPNIKILNKAVLAELIKTPSVNPEAYFFPVFLYLVIMKSWLSFRFVKQVVDPAAATLMNSLYRS